MKKESINNYYSEEDLINFKKLNNFSKIKNYNPNNNQTTKHLFKYSASDNNNFNKIMNINNNETSSSKETQKSKGNNYYNSSDFQKLNKLKELINFNITEDVETKKENSKTITSYTSDDVNKFNKIIKTKNENTNNKDINSRKIKIIDFNKLKENEKNIKNKLGIDKIKIVYFD